MSFLFSPFTLRGCTFPNRVFVSPMCMYSSRDGFPTDWHLVHLGSRAVGGAGLVLTEATAVVPEGRITPDDAGLWSEEQARAYTRITAFVRDQGAVPGVQLAHAGRKASTDAPWRGGVPVGPDRRGWETVAPSEVPFQDGWPTPRALAADDIAGLVQRFSDAAHLARSAGFQVLELHMAHGYLLHEFLSPLSNTRTDDYGGSPENRMRFPLEVARAVRDAWPADRPLLVRISATDWAEGGWDLDGSIVLARRLKEEGVDLIDCSAGGLVPHARVPVAPGYQVPFAAAIRKEAGIATGAVGLLTDPAQVERIVAEGEADVVFLARELLRDPYWPMRAARALGTTLSPPVQYLRAWS